jgi:alpha-glucosidase (family GH31 glycosyl hydrolase)
VIFDLRKYLYMSHICVVVVVVLYMFFRYLYTALRSSYDTGVGLIRPMYYDLPEEHMAYLQSLSLPQYFLGKRFQNVSRCVCVFFIILSGFT